MERSGDVEHVIADTGERFVISPNNKSIVRPSGQMLNLVQWDHNSERITFEIPRYMDNHDMSMCNRVEIHYLNTDIDTQITNEGLYEVDDLQIDPDDDTKVVCTWLVSQNATQLKGTLSFLLSFKCVQGNGTIDYVWNTAIYTDASVISGINVTDAVVEQYVDVLQEWYIKLFEMGGGNTNQYTGEPMLFASLTQAEYDALTPEEIIPDCHYIIEDDDTFERFEAKMNNGLQQMSAAVNAVNAIAEQLATSMDNINKELSTLSDQLTVQETTVTEFIGYDIPISNGDNTPDHTVTPTEETEIRSCWGSIVFRRQGRICTATFNVGVTIGKGQVFLLYDNIPEEFRPTSPKFQIGLLYDEHLGRTGYTEFPVYINDKQLKIVIKKEITEAATYYLNHVLVGSLVYFVGGEDK